MKDDFVMMPRSIKRAYIDGNLSQREFFVLLWVFLDTNPYNGRCEVSYSELGEVFQNRIKQDSMRQIISSLRHNKHIWFQNHKGKGGKFAIYPLDFQRTNKYIQTLDDFLGKQQSPSLSQPTTEPVPIPRHKQEGQNHNLQIQKGDLIKGFSMNTSPAEITTPYNDNENQKDKYIIDKEKSSFKPTPIEFFMPKSHGEQRCKEIAQYLGEKNINFILSVLKERGLAFVEGTFANFKESPSSNSDIENRAAYFNAMLTKEKAP